MGDPGHVRPMGAALPAQPGHQLMPVGREKLPLSPASAPDPEITQPRGLSL